MTQPHRVSVLEVMLDVANALHLPHLTRFLGTGGDEDGRFTYDYACSCGHRFSLHVYPEVSVRCPQDGAQ